MSEVCTVELQYDRVNIHSAHLAVAYVYVRPKAGTLNGG